MNRHIALVALAAALATLAGCAYAPGEEYGGGYRYRPAPYYQGPSPGYWGPGHGAPGGWVPPNRGRIERGPPPSSRAAPPPQRAAPPPVARGGPGGGGRRRSEQRTEQGAD